MLEETAIRPWGSYTVLAETPDYKVKSITVLPGRRLSLQRHARRNEHWFFVAGEGLITVGDDTRSYSAGDATNIPQGTLHRVANHGACDLVFIEIQRGDYFGEDDIERFEDDYGRVE